MELRVLGGAREVGRSAFLLKTRRTSILMDYGALTRQEPAFPMHVSPRDVDAIFLTHAHLDHSGGIPIFYISKGPELYATPLTLDTTELLIKDFIHLSGFYLPFDYIDLESMMRRATRIENGDEVEVGDVTVKFIDAGHIPGSSMFLVEANGKRILYTGDVNSTDTALLKGARPKIGELDLLITESTYALEDHPDRKKTEKELVSFLKEIVEGGGTALVPAFAVGRAQEVACILKKHRFPYKVYMDGMALKANEIMIRYKDQLRDPKLFLRAMRDTEPVRSWGMRRRIVKEPCVIIAPAGMLSGGTAVFYNSEVAKNPKNGVAIVAYQVQGTPGRALLEERVAIIGGRPRKVKARVGRFDLSSHSGRSQLLELIRGVKGNPKVLTVHGEEGNCVNFAKDIKETFGFDAHAPTAGEVVKL